MKIRFYTDRRNPVTCPSHWRLQMFRIGLLQKLICIRTEDRESQQLPREKQEYHNFWGLSCRIFKSNCEFFPNILLIDGIVGKQKYSLLIFIGKRLEMLKQAQNGAIWRKENYEIVEFLNDTFCAIKNERDKIWNHFKQEWLESNILVWRMVCVCGGGRVVLNNLALNIIFSLDKVWTKFSKSAPPKYWTRQIYIISLEHNSRVV